MKNKLTFLALLTLFAFSVNYAQVPVGGATGVSLSTNYTVPDGSLTATTDYELYVLDSGLASVISTVGFTTNGAGGAVVALGGPLPDNNTTYNWGVWTDGEIDPVTNIGSVLYGTFTFTTILGPPTATAASTITTTSFSANWTAHVNGGATSYRLDVGTSPGGTQILSNLNVGAVTTYSVTSLTAGTTYYYKVRAVNAGGTSANSNEISQITITSAPVATVATGMTTTSFSANWVSVTGAASYRIDVGTTPGGTDIKNDFVLGLVTTYSVTALTPGTTYYYKVRAVNAGGTSANSNEITTITLTGAPTLTAPVNGLTGVSVLPTVTWGAVTGAAAYRLYVDTENTFSNPLIFDDNTISATIKAFDATVTNFPLSNGTLYYWKVAGVNASGEGTSSSIYHFTTTPDPSITLSQPSGTIYSTPATFSWYSSGSTSGLKFIVQYKYSASTPANAEDEAFWSGGALTTLSSTTSLSITGAVLFGKNYYWRVLVQRTSNSEYVYYPMANVYNTFTTAGGSSVTVYPSWPIGGATVYTNAPTFYWYLDQFATGLKYQIKVSTSPTVVGDSLSSGTRYPTYGSSGSSNLYMTPVTLAPGTTYHWQVRAYYSDANVYSAWTTPESFTTNGSGTLQVPIPSYPTGGVTVYTTSPTVYWYFNTAVTGLTYQVDWVDSTAGGGHSQSANTLTPTSYQITGLTPGNTIGWRVRSYNGTNYSNYSSTVTFVVAGGTTASYAVASYPIGNPTVYTNQPTLYWYLEGSSLGIASYIVKYSKVDQGLNWVAFSPGGPNANEGQYTGLSNALFTKQITVPLTYGATYYWAVYATGTTSFNSLGVGSFTVVGGTGATTITLSTPSDASTVYSTSATLNWYVNGSSAGITSYTIQVSQSDEWTTSPTFLDETPVGTATSKALSGLTNGATYYWRVKGNYAVDPSTAWSSTFSFTVNTGSPSIVQPLVGGPNNVTVSTASPMLSWVLPSKASPNSTYEVQMAENPNFSGVQTKTFTSSKPNMVVNGLSGGKSYFWKVRSKDESGNTSYYSGTGQFKVNSSITAVEEKVVIPTQFELSQNYPNPFNPTTKISYALPQNAFVNIKVYDMLGREVKSLVNNEMLAGNHSIEWNGVDNSGNKVASGAYIYRISAGNPSSGSGQGFISTKKMVLLK